MLLGENRYRSIFISYFRSKSNIHFTKRTTLITCINDSQFHYKPTIKLIKILFNHICRKWRFLGYQNCQWKIFCCLRFGMKFPDEPLTTFISTNLTLINDSHPDWCVRETHTAVSLKTPRFVLSFQHFHKNADSMHHTGQWWQWIPDGEFAVRRILNEWQREFYLQSSDCWRCLLRTWVILVNYWLFCLHPDCNLYSNFIFLASIVLQ